MIDQCFDHIISSGGTSETITKSILSSLKNEGVKMDALMAIWCDGTKLNV